MKNGIRLIIAFACVILTLNGCGYGERDQMLLSAEELTFPAEGGSKTVTSGGKGFGIYDIYEEDKIPNNYIRIEDPYDPKYYCCFAQGEWITMEVTSAYGNDGHRHQKRYGERTKRIHSIRQRILSIRRIRRYHTTCRMKTALIYQFLERK